MPNDKKKIIYISYASEDQAICDRLVIRLTTKLHERAPDTYEIFASERKPEPDREWSVEVENAIAQAEGALVLLSPDLRESWELDALRKRTESSDSFSIIPVVLDQITSEFPRFLMERQYFDPENGRPLAKMSDEDFDLSMDRLADAIIRLTGVNQTARAEEPEPSPAPPSANPVDSPTRQRVPDPGSEESSLTPLSDPYPFELSRTGRAIINRAADKSFLGAPVSTSLLFFAMVDQASDLGDSTSYTLKFFADFVKKSVDPWGRFDQALREYLNTHGSFEVWPPDLEAAPDADKARPMMTVGALKMLEKAGEFAGQVEPGYPIYPRHILAALIHQARSGSETGVGNLLEKLGIPLESLAADFLEVASVEQAGKTELWEEFLSVTPQPPSQPPPKQGRVSRLAGFQADDARGEVDWLDIDPDVNAFAALIASRTVSPPLSIGLFGEWGSGKTFFMRRLRKRVTKLSNLAQNAKVMQRDLPYYKRIAQIEFNAWHYVESDLWASLVEHIFDNLYITGDKDVLKLQEHLIGELGVKKTELAAAKELEKAAGDDLKAKENELSIARQKLEEERQELQKVKVKDVLATLDIPAPLKNEIDELLEAFGITSAGNAVQAAKGSLEEARAVVERGNTLLNSLVKAKDKGRRFAWLLLCLATPFLAGVLIVWLRSYLNVSWVSDGITVLGGLATALITVAAWVGRQASWISEWLGKAERAKQRIDARIEEGLAEAKKDILDQEKKVEDSNTRFEEAAKARETAEARLAEATEAVKNATAERLLSKFIQDRAASDDYRKHLGVLALVRDDFENLSNYIEAQNWRLSPPDPDEPDEKRPFERFKDLEEEETDTDTRINRIVLYIDDLDRCPPNKVVDVLQAVHLLLAFPLFVVVVGVDARWVTRSLEARYRELLHSSKADGPEVVSETLIGAATPRDYLEKIFQVPFWLNAMNEDARARMIGGLLKGDIVRKEQPEEKPPPPVNEGAGKGKGAGPGETDPPPAGEKQVPPPAEPPGNLPVSAPPPVAFEPAAAAPLPADEEDDPLNQQKLEITQDEFDIVNSLSMLLGPSPRALKRFVNVYRLIKVGLTDKELSNFTSSEDGFTGSHAVLFLLAIDTGMPSLSQRLFRYFYAVYFRSLSQGPEPSEPENALLAELENDTSGDWAMVKAWQYSGKGYELTQEAIARIGEWAPRVARYSFQARKM